LCVWSIYVDRVAYNGKGRASRAFRNAWWWQSFRSYFPLSLRQEEEFDPSKRYIFVLHPHGILGFSAWLTFAADSTGFSKKNKDLDIAIATVNVNFLLPFWRDIVMAAGFLDASFKSLTNALRRNRSVTIVAGGAAEALDAHPGTYNIILNKRKGLVRLALTTGTPLVPVFSFGENDLFYQVPNPKGSLLRSLQEKALKVLKFSTPLIIGRGVFCRYGILPRAHPIQVVTGKPVPVQQIAEPSDEDIAKYQQAYRTALEKLFSDHAERYYRQVLPEELRPAAIPKLHIVA
ncbi:TPA: hypothetical protein N0F65_001641, partial [Lagenidium giganteum]